MNKQLKNLFKEEPISLVTYTPQNQSKFLLNPMHFSKIHKNRI